MRSMDTCLASQEIRQLLKEKVIFGLWEKEGQIQPSSFEPSIGSTAYVIDTETGLFRPQEGQRVQRTLLELPKRQRSKINLHSDPELRRGYTYLIQLREPIKKDPRFKFIISSPKSSTGRVFPNTRLLADYNASFDEIQNFPDTKESLDLWLLFQPLAFNFLVNPEQTLNQLRFFSGSGARLSPKEILEEWQKHPLLCSRKGEELVPINDPRIANSLQIHLDLEGTETGGIVALRARENPHPIDFSKKEAYLAEDYFEPIKSNNGEIILEPGRHYLLSSKEVLNIPPHLNAELGAYSHLGLSGPLHRAGFVDNGFIGDLVFEVTSQEPTNIILRDNMPIGELQIFRTQVPDKIYGERIGSHYHGQKGPKTPKFFIPFDFEFAAKNYKKLKKIVLVQDAERLRPTRSCNTGFRRINSNEQERLFREIQDNPIFHSRYDCESDDEVLQIIPYVIIFNPEGKVFSYVRASNIQHYGEPGLFGRYSIGVGGHILQSDAPNFILNGLEREVETEEINFPDGRGPPIFQGTMYANETPVDIVHFGLIYTINSLGRIEPKESSIPRSRILSLDEIAKDPSIGDKYETWSRILIPHLPTLYGATTKIN